MAHTHDVGKYAYNYRLSQKRVQAILDYLTKKQINPERLVAKGYGETHPLVPNDSEKNRALIILIGAQ